MWVAVKRGLFFFAIKVTWCLTAWPRCQPVTPGCFYLAQQDVCLGKTEGVWGGAGHRAHRTSLLLAPPGTGPRVTYTMPRGPTAASRCLGDAGVVPMVSHPLSTGVAPEPGAPIAPQCDQMRGGDWTDNGTGDLCK